MHDVMARAPGQTAATVHTVISRLVSRVGLGVAVCGTVTFAADVAGVVSIPAGARDLWLYNLVWVAAILPALVAMGQDRRKRGAWAALVLALVASLAGNVYYTVVLGALDRPPYPSWEDAALLVWYPLTYLTLMGLIRARITVWQPSLWLDGLILTFGTAAVGAAFVLTPVMEITDAGLAVGATNLAYPVGDLMLISTVLSGGWLLGKTVDRTLATFGAGLASMAVGDSIYLLQDSAGVYTEGTALDLTWLLGVVLIGAAAALGPSQPTSPISTPMPGATAQSSSAGQRSRWALLGVPATVALAALGCLLPWPGWQASVPAQWLAAAALIAAGARTVLTYREVWALADARRQAHTDELTGLTNRRGFTQVTDAHLDGNGATAEACALLLLDLDRFKEVNDSLGHHAGDQLLIAIAQRLSETCRGPRDLLGRLGGDEFAILLPGTSRAGAEHVATRIGAALRDPFLLDGVRVQAAISIGIAIAPDHGTTLSLLMRRADIAMYRAKATRSGSAVYDPDLRDLDREDHLQRIQELRAAIETGQIVVHYQPKIDLATGAATSVEALVRWDHPTRGLLGPDAFLPLTEDAGLMPALTSTVLDQAVAQAAAWHREGRDLAVAVNLPPAAVVDTDLPDRVADGLGRHGLPPSQLKLEITEESLLDDRIRAREVLARLRDLGVRIAIDDYGSGYSSLAYLRELPVDELKLDRSFIRPMADDARAAAIVRSTVELAHSLGLSIVAEGVEQAETAAELARYGCDGAQGFHYARALPPTRLTHWLDHRAPTPPPIPRPRPQPASHPREAPDT